VKTLEDIRRQLSVGQFEFTRHAFRRAVERNISDQEIRVAGAQARIIEDYPDDNILRVAYSWALPVQDAPCTCRFHT
jgi:hypothetical protein